MKIYTRTGDTGETGLYGGQRVRKDTARVEAYGAVDEANAALGMAIAALADSDLQAPLTAIQNALFVVGGDLATPLSQGLERVPRIQEADTVQLEGWIDTWEEQLAPLHSFILPGGTAGAAALHLARAIVRRAERSVVRLVALEPDETRVETGRYLNRLADALFVAARLANHQAGIADIPWTRSSL